MCVLDPWVLTGPLPMSKQANRLPLIFYAPQFFSCMSSIKAESEDHHLTQSFLCTEKMLQKTKLMSNNVK